MQKEEEPTFSDINDDETIETSLSDLSCCSLLGVNRDGGCDQIASKEKDNYKQQ